MRFKYVDGMARKLRTFVDFPLYDLNMTNHVHSYDFLTKMDVQCQYDLCGFINHYGSLEFGHYDAVIKNPFDGKWYHYDDHVRRQVPETHLVRANAYILFYCRKDATSKAIDELYPKIEELFPGKPVRVAS